MGTAKLMKGKVQAMRRSTAGAPSKLRKPLLIATLLVAALALIGIGLLRTRSDTGVVTTADRPPDLTGQPHQQVPEEVPSDAEPPNGAEPTERTTTSKRDGVFALDEVFDNPDCMFRPGGGAAHGTAAVVVPDESGGSRFKVLDVHGTLFEGELPFNPNKAYLGRAADQSMVAAFGDIRLNSKKFRERDTPEPVRVYRDGRLEYETPKARQFAVTSNGSAFVTLEPEADKTHVLKIRRFDPHLEREYSLGKLSLNMGNHVLYTVGFSNDWQDVKLSSSRWGKPLYFYPVDPASKAVAFWEGDSDKRQSSASIIPNRFLGYHKGWDRSDADSDWPRLRFWKETYEWVDGKRQTKTHWSTKFYTRNPGYAFLTHGGRYYIHRGEVVRVLNADTGELVFAYPTATTLAEAPEFMRRGPSVGRGPGQIRGPEVVVHYGKKTRERLKSVEYPDEVGFPHRPSSVYVRGGELILYGTVLRGGSLDCRTVPSLEYPDCTEKAVREHGARYMPVLDTFALEGLSMDSQPVRRIEYVEEFSCARGDFVFQGLDLVDGTFRFRAAKTLN